VINELRELALLLPGQVSPCYKGEFVPEFILSILAERDLERGLLNHLRQFLLELGVGFAFVGSQYRLAVGDQEFYIDPPRLPPEAPRLRRDRSEDEIV
jgi:YhcG PDDEXK nuclease domain